MKETQDVCKTTTIKVTMKWSTRDCCGCVDHVIYKVQQPYSQLRGEYLPIGQLMISDESLLIGCVSMTIILVVLLLLCSCYGQSVQVCCFSFLFLRGFLCGCSTLPAG